MAVGNEEGMAEGEQRVGEEETVEGRGEGKAEGEGDLWGDEWKQRGGRG